MIPEPSEKTAKPHKPRQCPGQDDQPGGPDQPRRGQRRGSRGHGRRDYSQLLTREEIHDVPSQEWVCRCCGAGYAAFGEETCEQIDWQVQLIRSCTGARPTGARVAARSAES